MTSDAPIDELDVADLESEAVHQYDLGAARDTDDQVLDYDLDGRAVADGARLRRTTDRFVLRGAGSPSVLVARLTADGPTEVEVRAEGSIVGRAVVSSGWTEARFLLPEGARSEVAVSAVGGGHFGSAHYWLYPAPPR